MITKVSEITITDLKNYLRLSPEDNSDNKYLETILNVAKDYIKGNTGVEDIDKYSDFVIVVYVLCQDMYDNRALYIDKNNVNKVVSNILGLHDNNLL